MSGIPKHPLDDMLFLKGYLSRIRSDDYTSRLAEAVNDCWPECDGHETAIKFQEWMFRYHEGSDV